MNEVIIRQLGCQDYQTCWQAMREFTDTRTEETPDEIWLLEHPAVFTQGQNGKPEHILNTSTIPIIPIDRGGQVTYHGPGQLVVYTLVNLRRKKLNIRQFVTLLEQSVVALLKEYQITAYAKCEAPGVYVDDKKICSIGLRVRRGCSYHGIALNVNMDLSPFLQINPCGFSGLEMTQLVEWAPDCKLKSVGERFAQIITKHLGYSHIVMESV